MLSQVLCVAFDAVGTLIFPDSPVAEVYAGIGKKYGSELSETEVAGRFREAFHAVYSDMMTPTDELLERFQWREIVHRVFRFDEAERTENCFEELFEHFGQASSWKCFPDVEETLNQLSSRNLQLIAASNFDRRLHNICDGIPELGRLDLRVISSEVGIRKPAEGFYRILCERVDREPKQILMVGDDWNNDAIGAMESGLQSVYLNRTRRPIDRNLRMVKTIHSLTELLELLP